MKEQKLNRSNVAIILVETRSAGNIGSIARSMTNMGFEDLRLVNPQVNHLDIEARWLAHGSEALLEKARVFPHFEEALADCSLLIATSHKKNRNNQRSFSSREIGEKIIPYCQKNKVAILFGRENHGLSNQEVNLCPWTLNIPSASTYPSLNLSQSVMLVCYELFVASVELEANVQPKCVGYRELELFFSNVLEILDLAGFHHKNQRPERFIGALRRILGRTGLQEQELKVLYKLFDQFKTLAADKKIDE